MLGARAAGELACSRSSAGGALRIAAGAARWPVAVEDRPAALNSSGCDSRIGRGRSIHHRRRLVKRTRAGLRHYHAPGGECGGGRCSVRVPLPAMSGSWRGSLRLDSNFDSRCLFGRNGGCFNNRRGRNYGSLCSFGRGSSHNRRCVNFSLGRGRWSFRSCSRRLGWRYRVLYDNSHSGRRCRNSRALCDYGACRSLGNNWLGWWARGNGWRSRRAGNNGRRRTRLRNDLTRFRLGRRCGRRRDGDNRRRWTRRSLGGLRCRTPLRHTALPGLFFLFLLLGQDGLQHVTRLGDMR